LYYPMDFKGFRSVQKLTTLNELKPRDGGYFAFFTEFDRFGGKSR